MRLNNFEMFPEKSQWLVECLRETPVHKRRLLLSDYKMIMNGTFSYWDKTYKESYQKQFRGVVKDWATFKTPISFCYSDKNEYEKRRSALLILTVVNPVTKKNEKIYFSQFIENDISITSSIKSNIIEPSEEIIRKRKDKLNELGITRMIVSRIQLLHRQHNLSPNVQGSNG